MRKTWALTENGRLRSHPEKGFVQGATKKLKSFFIFLKNGCQVRHSQSSHELTYEGFRI